MKTKIHIPTADALACVKAADRYSALHPLCDGCVIAESDLEDPAGLAYCRGGACPNNHVATGARAE